MNFSILKIDTIQTTMTTQTEMKMIEVINEFIIFMLTKNDEEKIIYSKLNELEDEDLEDWVNEKLKNYLGNEWEYEDEEEDINIENCNIHSNWSLKDCIDFEKIFTNGCELMRIQQKLINFNSDWFEGECINRIYCEEDILQYYCYMFLDEMSPIELKEYIINLIDPVEPK